MLCLIIAMFLLIFATFIEKILNPETRQNNINDIDLSKYTSNGYIMTQTELIFYRELKLVK